MIFYFRIPKKSEKTENILSDILKLESGRPGEIKIKCPALAPAPERKAVMKRTKGTQTKNTKTFDAIARLEKEFEKSAEDLGISDQVKAKLTGSPMGLQKEFYYR